MYGYLRWLRNEIYGQAVHFVNTRDDMPEATRVHLEPTINLPLSNNWGSINTEAKLLATHYQQTNLDWYNSRNTTKLEEPAGSGGQARRAANYRGMTGVMPRPGVKRRNYYCWQ